MKVRERMRWVYLVVAALAGAAVSAVLLAGPVSPVTGEGTNLAPEPASATPVGTVPASKAQALAAGATIDTAGVSAAVSAKKAKKATKRRPQSRRVIVRPRITPMTIVTEENKGTYVGVNCPAGSKAVAGGVLSRYINLLVSSSAPNHPLTGKFTPRTWWLTVTNTNIDGHGGSLPWRGVVTCMSPLKLGS